MRHLLKVLLMLLCWHGASAQPLSTDSLFHLPDSARPFTIENFYEVILKYHPVARQSYLLPDLARQEIRLARGNFDPKLELEYLTKHYEGTRYYSQFESSLKVPTRSPINPSLGIEQNDGVYLNPENYISNQYDYRQFYAGISLPLGKGLITDERRTALRQAELFAEMMQAEQVSMMNKLLLEAAKDYWLWFSSYYTYRLTVTNTAIAQDIFRRTLLNYQSGEAAVIDTVQAKISWIERQTAQQESMLQWRNQSIKVSTYLWDSLLNPVELPVNFVPVLNAESIIDLTTLQQLLDQAKQNHPDLLKTTVKIRQLENERRLAAEFLKPQLNLNYYLLNQPLTPEGRWSFEPDENYKLGVDFSIPVFLRKERSKLSQTKIKINHAHLELSMTERTILNSIIANFNQIVASRVIVSQQTENVSNYQRLIDAELMNLANGESDLFKLNIQLEKLFNSQSKLVKAMSELEKQKAELYWAAGVRPIAN